MRLLLITLGLLISLSAAAQQAREKGTDSRARAYDQLAQALASRIRVLQEPLEQALLEPEVDGAQPQEPQARAYVPLASPVSQAVLSFYEQRRYQPAWFEAERVAELIEQLQALALDGLEPDDYAVQFLEQMHGLLRAQHYPRPAVQVEWELLATNAYLRALYHLYNGKVNPAGLDPQWNFELFDLSPGVVAGVMSSDHETRSLAGLFARARPQHPSYDYLRAGLARYRQLAAAGGWPVLPAGPTLKPCMIDPQIAILRERLTVTGDYQPVPQEQQAQAVLSCLEANARAEAEAQAKAEAARLAAEQALLLAQELERELAGEAPPLEHPAQSSSASSATHAANVQEASSATSVAALTLADVDPNEVYDAQLQAALEQFQRDQYLEPDGAIGPATRAALNVSAQARVDQIRVNLDRARWLLHNIPPELLLVDVAGYKVTYFKGGAPIWSSRVQVGMTYRTTPIFTSEVNYITLNPTWTVPPTILRKDVLPKVRQDLNYLRANNIRVFDANGKQLDPASIDWNRPGNVTLRQDAGPDAALGKAVIRFPNPYSVFLHDTPYQRLFSKSQRAFSSGCIRVERAMELVELLLEDTPEWDKKAIDKTLASGRTRNAVLAKRVPLMLAYWTVDAVSETKVAFKPDIYARDGAVLAALNQRVSQPLIELPAP